MTTDKDILIKAENVSKKFCRSLKQSLYYGIRDMTSELLGLKVGRSNLRKNEFWAVKDISFELRRGECLGLIGLNGAGKSTLLKMLNGLICPDEGKITMAGRVGALIELGAGFTPILTGRENIYVNGSVLGFSKKDIDDKLEKIIEFSGIGDFVDTPVQNYSSGMKVRLGFAIAAQTEPDVLLIDEVLAVGDLGFQFKCLNKISEIMSNSAVIFVSHSMPMVARICSQALLMDTGRGEFYDRNVPMVIDQYIKKFTYEGIEQYGDGSIKIKSVGIRASCEDKYVMDDSSVFENGSQIQLKIEIDVKYTRVDPFYIFIKMFDQQMREAVNCISNYNSGLFAPKTSALTVQVTIQHLYLNRGKYFIAIGAESEKSKILYGQVDGIRTFIVRSPITAWGTSIVPGIWEELT